MRAAAVRNCHAAAFLITSSCTATELGPTCFAICPSDSARFSSHRREACAGTCKWRCSAGAPANVALIARKVHALHANRTSAEHCEISSSHLPQNVQSTFADQLACKMAQPCTTGAFSSAVPQLTEAELRGSSAWSPPLHHDTTRASAISHLHSADPRAT